ncbi:hypothetical protein DH2020_009368 [Rehmannia glutinosa]|uniref:F-box domain-containing protein n=1 Tax=Rehmannia glutinosa TaxID=99300 RepID=A0ABR0X6Q3_REHGL
MAEPSSSGWSSTTIADLDMDTLTRCASYLSLQDISNVAMSCKYLNRAAYSDSIWQSIYSQEWPHVPLPPQASSIREAYLSRRNALHEFKYDDPLLRDIYTVGDSPDRILLDKKTIIFSQTFSLSGGLYQSESEGDDNVLVSSSTDRFVRLWSKGGSRCFKGHTGPVLTLSDKLLGDNTGKVFASGGEDATVRLWSINSSGKRGQHALKATLHGHETSVSLMSVAGHKTCLLVSISRNGKVKVWDTTTASSSNRSSCCVGMTSVHVSPIAMKCDESLLYVATGSSVLAIDLRTMSRAFTIFPYPEILSFEFLPSKSLLCTGGYSSTMLWDIRRVSDTLKVEPTVELLGHVGPVKFIHMDSHKVVTGGPDDPYVKVWETGTGLQTNSLICSEPDRLPFETGCSAMAVDGCRIVTGCLGIYENPIVRFRDFKTATCQVSSNLSEASSEVSKFWRSGSASDGDGESDDETIGFRY